MTILASRALRRSTFAAAAVSTLAMTAACGSSTVDTDHMDDMDHSAMLMGPFADGTYTAVGEYVNPAGRSKVEVTLTLAGDVVTAVTVTPRAENATSMQFQRKFTGGIAAEVVGKRIDDLNVHKVAGSSLTYKGFEDALVKIAADARP